MPSPEPRPESSVQVGIRPFQPGDGEAFRRLNEEWITRYFRLEAKDEKTLRHPQETILDPGGQILFATVDGKCVGCVALLRMSDDEFEVAKMAVSPAHQGAGLGKKLMLGAIATARHAGARRLYIETNHTLTPAIRLYESVGFRHLAPGSVPPSPYARADVYMEMILD